MEVSAMLMWKGAFVIFLPGNLRTMHGLELPVFYLETLRRLEKEEGAGALKRVSTVLSNVCDDCVMTPVDIQK